MARQERNMGRFFSYNNRPYMRVVPSKRLFNSSTVHEVVNRGDFFAVDLSTGLLTVLPKDSDTKDVPTNGSNA